MDGYIVLDSVTISYASPRGNMCRRCKRSLASGSLRFGMIFKSPPCSRMLFQGFHLQCIEAPPELTDSTQLEGIEDIRPADVDEIKRWIERGTTPGKFSSVEKHNAQVPQGLAASSAP